MRGSHAKAVSVSLIIVVGLVTCGCTAWEPTPIVSFSVAASAYQPTVIIVPMPVLQVMVDDLHVSEGEGTFELVKTGYGQALRVEFDESVVIKADWWPKGPEDFPNMTINLTMMVPLESNESLWDPHATHGGIPDRELHINVTSGWLKGVSIYSHMMFDRPIEGYYFGSYKNLQSGWNRVWIEGRQGGVNVD